MSGLNSVAVMCESLANYFRYTISNLNDIVTLEEEIKISRPIFLYKNTVLVTVYNWLSSVMKMKRPYDGISDS